MGRKMRRLGGLTAFVLAVAALPLAQAAEPSEATVSLDSQTAGWQGQHYPAGSTVLAGASCQVPSEAVCDRFTLTVDVPPEHWEEHSGGVEVAIRWPDAEDDFDLHVYDAEGKHVDSSIQAGTTGERVVIDEASGTYSIRVNPFFVTDSGYDGDVRLHSRRATPQDGGDVPDEPLYGVACQGGQAGPFPCKGVDLAAFVPHSAMGGGAGNAVEGNDIWGWTDPDTGREYALVGQTTGTAFVDVTTPNAPVYLGDLPSHQPVQTLFANWRDVKVYADHAFVVSEEPAHGMQVFDLRRLRGATEAQTWTEDAHYPLFGGAHNVAINEDTGFAYAVGSATCSGGPHMVDIREPQRPVFAGCDAEDGYTHDTQCVVYHGPDEDFQGQEVCFHSNEDSLTIVDVTDKSAPDVVSRTPYQGATYAHQGWLTEDQRHFLLGDELDEVQQDVNTSTYIFEVVDLRNPVLRAVHRADTEAIDHNLYVKGNRVYQANYRAGLRILNAGSVASGVLPEVAYFDVYPADDDAEFNGAWSSYPYFESGTVIVNGIEQGLFVLQPR